MTLLEFQEGHQGDLLQLLQAHSVWLPWEVILVSNLSRFDVQAMLHSAHT